MPHLNKDETLGLGLATAAVFVAMALGSHTFALLGWAALAGMLAAVWHYLLR